MHSLISVNDLSVSYDRKRVLTNIFLDIGPGRLYGILGPNGAGKSTLLKAMLGLVGSSSGTVLYEGKTLSEQRGRVAYVPQKNEVDWYFPATVYDVVLMGRYPHKRVFQRLDRNDHDLALGALRDLGILALKDRPIGELSGGQQQRVFLARALCQQADIFFLDEPFVGVDVPTEEKIIQLLKQLAAAGKTLLVVHHDLSSVKEYFDRVVLVNQRLIGHGDTATTFTQENIALTYGAQLSILHSMGLVER